MPKFCYSLLTCLCHTLCYSILLGHDLYRYGKNMATIIYNTFFHILKTVLSRNKTYFTMIHEILLFNQSINFLLPFIIIYIFLTNVFLKHNTLTQHNTHPSYLYDIFFTCTFSSSKLILK